tara:strand:- start:193 stop:717 length:525 start_codon:yes stop_codon:yes gene_type:complete
MILTCNSCGKKFVVPDNAITASGRTVQCGSCGNKWKQFPINEIKKDEQISKIKKIAAEPKQVQPKIQKAKKVKKAPARKPREINLYSPEYLAKKHGIKLNNVEVKKSLNNNKVSFGFYNSLLLFLVVIVAVSRGLYFFQDFLVQKFPFIEFYLDYFFENIRNIFEIWKNLISSY